MEKTQPFNDLICQVARVGVTNVQWCGEKMNDSQLDTLISAMELSPVQIENINLSKNEITSAGASLLCTYIKKNSNIKEVYLNENLIDDAGAREFISIFNNQVHPTIFDVSGNQCSSAVVNNLALLAKQDQHSKEIHQSLLAGEAEELDISGMNINKIDPRLLTFFILDTHALRSLIVSGCAAGDAGATLIGDLLKNSAVSHVDLSDNDISDAGVSQFIERADLLHHPTITSISFSKNIRISNYGMQQMSKTLFNTNDVITSFDVSDTSVTSSVRSTIAHECELNKEPSCLKRAVAAIRTNDPSCTSVNLQWERLTQTAARFVAPVLKLNTIMLELNLGNTSAGDKGAELLAAALQQNKTLRILGLANNNITSRGAKVLFQRLHQQGVLEELNLANNRIDDEAETSILNTLQLNPTIKVLNLVNNLLSGDCMSEIDELILLNQAPKTVQTIVSDIENRPASVTKVALSGKTGEEYCNDTSVRILCNALVLNKVVTTVDLSKNVVGDIGVTYLCEMLMTNSTIVELNLESNSITDRGAQRLAHALRTNASLQHLNLSNNSITDVGAGDFVDTLRFNYALTSILFEKTTVTSDLRTKIAEAADMNKEPRGFKDVMYMLRDGSIKTPKLDLARKNCPRPITDESVNTLCVQLRGISVVRELILSGNSVGTEGCKSIGKLLAHEGSGICHIDLSLNPVDDEGLGELAKGLLSKNCVLQILNLRGTEVTSTGIINLTNTVKANATLREVIVPERVSADVFCRMNQELMVNAQPKSLKPLLTSINENEVIPLLVFKDPVLPFTDAACHLLCAAIVNNEHITSVDMSNNKLTSDSVPFIAEALSSCPKITSVNLSHNEIDETGGYELVKCLAENDYVTTLSLEGNPIPEEVIFKLNELLHLNRGSIDLKKILLKHRKGRLADKTINLNSKGKQYKLNDEDVRLLCEVMVECGSIRAVDLGMNMITDVGCEMIADALLQAPRIEAIYLDYNPIGEIGGEALYNVLKVNHQIHTLLLEGTNVPEEIWEEILSLLRVNETANHERIDMRAIRLEEVNDETQFRSTDYAISQEQKVGIDAFKAYESSVRALVKE
ncbi:paraflagellar rod component [Trypanosoma brucei equiperdum]|uniref:Paraflagellar rod component n=1 Tax=Trypanosoma brucei equiperdum TaxID=630700 RepID=A0A3L6KZG5_9TRYP|nr:paraflagellar rod component [Trypanosoma brucei equiperdum]